ncbi:hypothetical protein [Roseovarius sp. M141]|uniref:hypothetical protein n=1 Tax=Roseovarius sp. M141 TaxID=2583806 RepID=UPI0020CF4392|nr:hypothetical protein [Roseovarius sp. M141]MCQ0093183.1 DUF1801 domain-containing protein [Roseovarius sp. M141]
MTPLPAPVAKVVTRWPDRAQAAFHVIRRIVLNAAASTPPVGALSETLKWGEPAWLTGASRSGTTLRCAWQKAAPDHIGVYVNCRTDLAETMRSIYPGTFRHEGSRGLLMPLAAPLPEAALDHCAHLAQSYHLRKGPRP